MTSSEAPNWECCHTVTGIVPWPVTVLMSLWMPACQQAFRQKTAPLRADALLATPNGLLPSLVCAVVGPCPWGLICIGSAAAATAILVVRMPCGMVVRVYMVYLRSACVLVAIHCAIHTCAPH